MSKQWNRRWQQMRYPLRYLLVIPVVLFISLLFPNNARFHYEYERGQTWRYEDLYAPYPIPIRKSAEELAADRAEVSDNFEPYYGIDPTVERKALENFQRSFAQRQQAVKQSNQYVDIERRPDIYTSYGRELISRIYGQGIPRLDPAHSGKGNDFVINVVNGNTTYRSTLQQHPSPENIAAGLPDSLFRSRLPEADFLIPLLKKELFQPNLFYNDSLSKRFLNDRLAQVATSSGMIQRDELIVRQGDRITESIYRKLESFRAQYETELTDEESRFGVYAGYFLLTTLLVGVFMLFLQFHGREIFSRFTRLLFMMMWLVIFSYLVFAVESNENLSVYLIPFCIVPIIIRIFYNTRIALFTHVVVVLVASFLSSLGYQFTFLQILAGIVAVLTQLDIRNWTKYFLAIFYIFLAYALGHLGLELIEDGSLLEIDWSVYTWLSLNVILTLLSYPLIPLFERLFGFTSPITLVELSDMNKPLLRDLSLKAPGTLQHSLQVANLAEVAASAIGADQLLVKVAALYHDVGKMKNPRYFIENQSGTNPHDGLNEKESARIIIEHVSEGVKMAKKQGLPEVLIDFIRTHHGTTRVEYFYRNQLEKQSAEEVNERDFRYTGPRPRTKEETILMMADSIEAASKSLKQPTDESINDLVEKIIAGKINNQQFEHSMMTFEELDICKQAFKKLLHSIYHVRIEYPDQEVSEDA